MKRRARCALILVGCLIAAHSASAQEYRNWFNDSFFQISSADPACPEPAGPFVNEEAKRAQAHHRSEKGTTCWLAGECDCPKAYLYDADIAAAIQKSLKQIRAFKSSTLWITVQGRVVYIEGCASNRKLVDQLEARIRGIQFVQQTSTNVRIDRKGQLPSKPPYLVRQRS
jgi:hypothetical protein